MKKCLALLLLLCLWSACSENKGKPTNVMVVFSYDKNHHMYKGFLEEVEKTFQDGGYSPNIQAVYMDMENPSGNFMQTLRSFRDSTKQLGWEPDIMLFEGDRPARTLIDSPYDEIFDFNHIPIVCGGLHHPNDWKNLQGKTNIARWNDPMDFTTNIDMAVKLSGVNLVEVELDYNVQDLLLRKQLAEQTSRPPYLNDMDFHLTDLSDKYRTTALKDSITVIVLSAQEPWKNIANPTEENADDAKQHTHNFLAHSWKYPSLVVKKDVYADLISSRTNRPQFTAVKSDFGNGLGDYLAGYFASYNTIAHDISTTAIQILNGKEPNRIDVREHKKEYWMDYQAMEKLGMKWSDYRKDYNVINVPYSISHRQQYFTIITCILLVILSIAGFFIYMLLSFRTRMMENDKRRLNESIYITQLCLQGADSFTLDKIEDIQKYMSRMSPGQLVECQKITESLKTPGEYRFKVWGDLNESGNEEWWELRYVIYEDAQVNGLVLNVNEREHQKRLLEEALATSQESKKKENFMLKTSREISAPLNAIKIYSDKLTSGKLNDEEKRALSARITQNSELLIDVISDILLFSRIESGRQQYFMIEQNVKTMMDEFYEEWKEKIPKDITFKYIEGRPDISCKVDRDRLHDIIHQFMDNAIKFTETGTIYLGWRYHLTEKQTEFFVEDTGSGISEAKQKVAFSLFWKANDFMPGVGLGLNIAKRLADNMDGHITLSSQENVGSRFSVWI